MVCVLRMIRYGGKRCIFIDADDSLWTMRKPNKTRCSQPNSKGTATIHALSDKSIYHSDL